MKEFEPFKDIEEALEMMKTSLGRFEEKIAPRRYKHLRDLILNDDIYGAIVIYGLRRTGKTTAVVEIAKAARKSGYRVFYTDLDSPEFDPSGDVMKGPRILKTAFKLASLALKDRLLVIIDEAFISSPRTIHKFLEKFKLPYDEGKRFIIILLGSYGTDIERVRVYLRRTVPARNFSPVISSLPRACIGQNKLEIDFLEALTYDRNHEGRREVLKSLEERGFLKSGFLGISARINYEKYITTLGMPEALIGSKTADELVEDFPGLVEESIARFKSIVKAAKDEATKYRLITYPRVMKRIVESIGTLVKPRNVDEEHLKLIEFALNLDLLVPRWYLDNSSTIQESALEISTMNLADLLSNRKMQPTAAHLFAYSLISRVSGVYNRRLSSGLKYESIVAHALIEHASRFESMITRMPIFSAQGVDFVYHFRDILGEGRTLLIEVKTGERIRSVVEEGKYRIGELEDIDKAIDTAERLDKNLVIVTDSDRILIGRRSLKIQDSDVTVYVVPVELFFSAVTCF